MTTARRIGSALGALALVGGASLGLAPQAEAATWKTHHQMVQSGTMTGCQGRLSNAVRQRSAEGARIGSISQCRAVPGGYRASFYFYVPVKSSQ